MWVIQQCCDRVPETLQAAKELLEFGLEITNEEILNGWYRPAFKIYHNNFMVFLEIMTTLFLFISL